MLFATRGCYLVGVKASLEEQRLHCSVAVAVGRGLPEPGSVGKLAQKGSRLGFRRRVVGRTL